MEVKNIKCIKGKYPERLIELWNIYDEEKHSDNDCPSMFNDEQLYIVLELGHGGQDLEAFVFNTAEEAYILFIQVVFSISDIFFNKNLKYINISSFIIIYQLFHFKCILNTFKYI